MRRGNDRLVITYQKQNLFDEDLKRLRRTGWIRRVIAIAELVGEGHRGVLQEGG